MLYTTQMKASELFVASLEAAGITHIFGVPGEENLAFMEAVRKSKITFITTRHEQGAVFMAATIGRLTGKTGVALSTLGPGATNLVTGVAYAQLGGMPLLVITGQKPIKHSKQGKFQIIDVVRMMEPITKYTTTVVSGDRIPSIVYEAIKIAESERPGAVHIELPEDIAEETTTATPILMQKNRRPIADEKSIALAQKMIAESEHPIIVLASGANRRLVRKQLEIFIQKTGIPFVTTQMGKGVLDERSPLYIGTTALSQNDYVHKALTGADTIIMIGHDISEKPPIVLTPETHKVIHINFSPADIDAVYVPSLEVVGDISHTIWALGEKITPSVKWDFTQFLTVKKALLSNIESQATNTDFPLRPERIVADLRTALPKDGILSLDNGLYKLWIARNFAAYEQNSVLLDNTLATMGAGLSAGTATKLLYPDRKVVVVAGDGGFMMNLAELETAKRLGVNLVVLLLRDDGYGMIKWKQQDMHFDNFSLEFSNPDFVALAQSFGVTGHSIATADDLLPTLQKALSSKGVHIIDCPINYASTNGALGADLRKELDTLL